jgi:hypothetical protein
MLQTARPDMVHIVTPPATLGSATYALGERA